MDLSQKSPFAVTMTNYIQSKIDANQENFGWQLPCRVVAVNGAIVTVAFEIDQSNGFTFPQVECAIAESTYVQIPVQVGDFGICIAANARLGGINGLGSGVAPLTTPLNLEGLVYLPISSANWDTLDPNAVVINAPNGAIIRTINGNSIVTISETEISLAFGSTTVTLNSSGVSINGTLTINGTPFLAHEHTGVQSGTSNTGGVV